MVKASRSQFNALIILATWTHINSPELASEHFSAQLVVCMTKGNASALPYVDPVFSAFFLFISAYPNCAWTFWSKVTFSIRHGQNDSRQQSMT